MEKKKFTLPVSWEMYATVTVEADSLEEAVENFNPDSHPLPESQASHYIDGSFQLVTTDLDDLRAVIGFIYFHVDEDTMLAKCHHPKTVTPIALTQDHQPMIPVSGNFLEYSIEQTKLIKEFGDEWNYEDWWKFIGKHGLGTFLEKFTVIPPPKDAAISQ
ncbi:hypothetical protein OH491_24330 [Termitidicoccus mucosus]|uniref:Uncharacterized protein n=1 Tax=Termitidicoccus mucosus TaxID=1184151 RepID=A0A178INZ6_9BACT|nr:hypothetical protein AW736_02110 [Opitutaceae bacterium TSB47]